jgi:L-alanine-DL-glutamate epimerase-like enolase superfamily enzyme
MVTAAGTIHDAEHVLVRVRTDDGLVGVAEASSPSYVYGESQASIVEAVRLWFRPALLGTDPFAVEDSFARLAWVPANNTTRGAVDIALHDLRGKATGLPSWRMLGGSGTPMRVTQVLTKTNPEEAADEARQAVQRDGITSFKIKVGWDVPGDLARVAAVREAVGSDATIYVDANHGWRAEHAVLALMSMEDYNVDLVEEPNPAEDLLGRQRVAISSRIPIMADESAPTLKDATREIMSGAARALSIKTTRTGFTESARIIAMARALGARTILGTQADGMIGTAASLAFGSAFPPLAHEPGELNYFSMVQDYLSTEPLRVRDGRLTPLMTPGIGLEIDEDKVRHYRIDQQ